MGFIVCDDLQSELTDSLLEKIASLDKNGDRKALKIQLENAFSHYSDDYFITTSLQQLSYLQHLLYEDFLKNKNPDLLNVLIEHNVSPLTKQEMIRLSSPPEKLAEAAATTLQRRWRSQTRYKLHQTIFNTRPSILRDLPLKMIDNIGLRKLILELTASNAIIDNQIYHWTTLVNFKNIIRNNSFYGNKILKANHLFFQKNALDKGDVDNGDEKIICFCPYLVDPLTLSETSERRPQGLLRLTLNLNKLTKFHSMGKYNQFMKIFDLHAPSFSYSVKITDKFSVKFCKQARSENTLNIIFTFDDNNYITRIQKKEAFFYGNLSSINRFCLMKLFDLVNRATLNNDNSSYLGDIFLKYLDTLKCEEVKKILIILGQSMTVFAEYNFNSALELSNDLISEVYFAKTNMLISFNKLPEEERNNFFQTVLSDKADKLQIFTNPTPPIVENLNEIYQYGICSSGPITIEKNLIEVPASIFNADHYIDVRQLNMKY
jgi:hypothetical protein